MRPGIRRFTFGAFAALGLFAATAQAQTSVTTSKVNLDAATAITSSSATSIFAPKVKTSFLAQQMGASAEDSGIGFGVLGMITRSSLRSDDFTDLGSRTGAGIGLWVGGNRNGRVGFTGEFIFLTRKFGERETAGSLRVLEIPAVFHINLGSRSRNGVGGYVVVGPAVSFKLKESFTGGFGEDNFGGVDIGLIGGVGVEVYRIGIEGRGNWGLRNISDAGDTSNIKTFTFELLGKFAFN